MPLKWTKRLIASATYEACGVFDVNNDGILDIISGAYWYEGPDFKTRHTIGEVRAEGEYFHDFGSIPLDINGDGFMDYVTGSWWGKTLQWRENPGDPDKEWTLHETAPISNCERPMVWDVDGDGIPEIVPNTPSGPLAIHKLVTDADGRGTGKFIQTVIRKEAQGHGLGCGDIARNGRMDFVMNNGWLEAPADPYTGEWAWHPEFQLFPSASCPILVVDVNGDGLNDIIVGGGHAYGLDWYEQKMTDGKRSWIRHPIDPFNSQYHDMKWVDIDGDGQPELVTGKRYRAHCGKDPGSADDIGIYYFKWTGEGFAKQIIDYGPPDKASGCGIYFAVVDLNGNGRLDIVAPGKDGLYVFLNEGLAPGR